MLQQTKSFYRQLKGNHFRKEKDIKINYFVVTEQRGLQDYPNGREKIAKTYVQYTQTKCFHKRDN